MFREPSSRPPIPRPWLVLGLLTAVLLAAAVALLLPGPLQRTPPLTPSTPMPALQSTIVRPHAPGLIPTTQPCPTPRHSNGPVALIEAVVDERGHVESACVVLSVSPVFDRRALEFVRSNQYEPATHEGKPIKVFLRASVFEHPR